MKNSLLTICLLSWASPLLQGTEPEHPIQVQSSIEYSIPDANSTAAREEKTLPRIESYFNNRDFLLQLNQGADLLNTSMDTLMQSMFYHLLDHVFYRNITENLFLTVSDEREVYSTESGAYVVVDKIQYGPEFYKQIANLHGLDVFLGAKSGVNLLDIRLRSDAQRLTDAKELPPYRYFINNWFGLVPLLERILPPSFNPNEIYDPLQQAETPFRFPMTESAVESMPAGTIRSYSLTGGVSIPFNFPSLLKGREKDNLSKIEIQNQLPYAVFIQGEHKIHVLKRSSSIFWVGVSNTERIGHSISALLGKTYYFLKNSIRPIPWSGLAVLLAPLKYEWSDAIVHNYDHLYEFDMTNPIAKSAYFKAVAGDFRQAAEFKKEQNRTGVRYHFTKHRDAEETGTESSRNFILFRHARNKNVTKAETKLIEPQKTSYYLEGSGSIQDEGWDILVGKHSITYEFSVSMEVDKLAEKKIVIQDAAYRFHDEKNKYQARIFLNIQDRYMDARDYQFYIDTLRKFSRLPISEAPIIPFFDEEKQKQNRRRLYFQSPIEAPITTHVVETELGKFSATGTIALSFAALTTLIQAPIETQWKGLADAYGLQETHPDRTRTSSRYADWLKKGLILPAKLVDARFLWGDGVLEVDHIVAALQHLRKATAPLDTLKGFYNLFNLDYPHLALDGFLRILQHATPSKVIFNIDPISAVEPGFRKNLLDLNQQAFTSSLPFPEAQRPSVAKEKLQAFFPNQFEEFRDHPTLASLSLSLSMDETDQEEEIFLRIQAKNVKPHQPLQLFLQMEESGKHKVGKQILSQKVVIIYPTVKTGGGIVPKKLHQQTYEVWITGAKSPLSTLSYDAHMEAGGDMQLRVAISGDGKAWSDKKILGFFYQDHQLFRSE